MAWIATIIKAIVSAVLDWWQKQREKPAIMQDANTPPEIADANAAAFDKWKRMRDAKDNDSNKG